MSLVGTNINTDTFMVGFEYDSATRRPVKTTYPSAGGSSLTVYNSYNPTLGYLEKVSSGAGGTGTVYWQATALDTAGHVTEEKLGNGLFTKRTYDVNTGWVTAINTGTTAGGGTVQNESFVYDKLGNLTRRADTLQNYTENFTYGSLNRLRTASYNYDSLGNITFQSDVGTYTYADPVRTHAVTSVAGNVNGAINPVYSYDANGNLFNGGGRTISSYSSFNMPTYITSGTEVVSLSYDAEHQRIVQVKNGETTEYLDARWDTGVHFEKEYKKDGSIEYQHYINAPVGQVAQYTVKVAGSVVTSTTRYLHKDHLGSVDTVTSDTGAVVTRFRYDPFGKQQTLSGDPNVTHHGYTGHEMMNGVGLINMNGRVYDPSLGRFMQADPFIQAPAFSQSYNRYSYVLNNPLSFTDPSGYATLLSKRKWKKITGDLVRDISKTTIEINIPGVYQQRYRVGGILTVAALTGTLGYAYGWSNNDWKTVARAHATAGVMVLAYMAMPGAPVDLTWATAGMYVGQSAAVGYASSNATARIWGASASEAHQTGLDGARTTAIIATLAVAAQAMRADQIQSSRLNPDGSNESGTSAGVRGDNFKLGGCRSPCTSSPLGGIQGQQGNFIVWDYTPGGVIDFVVENFSGTHDYFNSGFWYDAIGNGKSLSSGAAIFGEILNGANVVLASPFAIASMLPPGSTLLLQCCNRIPNP